MKNRINDIKRFYQILDRQEQKIDGRRLLDDCTGSADFNGKLKWPSRGVYFFMEEGENRTDSGEGLRIVRVGTHAVSQGSKSKLWQRLRAHRGIQKSGGGNHRGSIFRKLVGMALISKYNWERHEWGNRKNAPRDIRKIELPLEKCVSKIIREMPFIWLEIDDEPGKDSKRKYIERNSIALLSNREKEIKLDQASRSWLGRYCGSDKVQKSGLWNQAHVDEEYDPNFLEELDKLVK